ncbi:MAG: leucine-rich repeat domain-containing protein [Candidatus Kariarchaeaceae archaeon]|jgi:hypothetical protein
MTETEVIGKLLGILGRSDALESVVSSPQTEFDDGKLLSIDLSDLGIQFLPDELFSDVSDIKRIHLSFNFISELSEDAFRSLPSLEFLNLYGNQLVRIPDGIFDGLSKLEWLDLRSNMLEAIPKSVGTLAGLKYLFLQNNPLSDHADFNWANDYHSARDVKKFMPEFQEAMGQEVTTKKPPTRQEIAEAELKKRQTKEAKPAKAKKKAPKEEPKEEPKVEEAAEETEAADEETEKSEE